MCHEIFDLHFFHDSNPSRPLINRLKYFRIRFRFRRDIRIFKKLHGVHHTAESSSACLHHTAESSSAVCIIPRSQAPRCASHRGVKLRRVHNTAESRDEKFSKTPRCASHRGVNNLSSVCFIPKFYKCFFSVMPKDINPLGAAGRCIDLLLI